MSEWKFFSGQTQIMEIVLVTAGNSFVGQHFIKHLQLYGPPTLKEIRVLDGKPFENRLSK